MNPRQQSRADFTRNLIQKSRMPRNQIAVTSGLTNTYIRDLENGHIANVGREKLIALAVALNLDLNTTDDLLTVFDRAKLSTDDIPLFLDRSRQRKLSGNLYPLKDFFAYELMVNSVERIPGDQVIVNDTPTNNFRVEGHRTYTDRQLVQAHPIYGELVEAVGRERQRTIAVNLGRYGIDHFICHHCLEEYVRHCSDPEEKRWRCKHVGNLLWHVSTYGRFRLFLTGVCSTFLFTIKYVADSEPDRDHDKLCFSGKAGHSLFSERPGRLTGFATDNPVLVTHFKEELEALKATVLDEYLEPARLERFLEDLIHG